MSIIDTEDLAEMQGKQNEIETLLQKWETLITKTTYMEIELHELKF